MPNPAVDRLRTFLDASPTPHHAVAMLAAELDAHGFSEIDPGAAPAPLRSGTRGYVRKSGTLIAFVVGQGAVADHGFRIVAAHTDSPNLRIKPQPLIRSHGWVRLGVEVYGGAIVATWADRDLGIAGNVVVRDGSGRRSALVDLRRPLCRIPNLAIHLNREVNDQGLKLNAQTQLPALLALSDDDKVDPLRGLLAEAVQAAPEDLLSWDLALMDLTPAAIGGANGEVLFSARLDNQASCHAGLEALLASVETDHASTSVLACFDHEEIGSNTARGADGRTLESVLRLVAERATNPGAGGLERALVNSVSLSADMAHAVHPGYADKHDPEHMPRLNKGPVIKTHANQHYATESDTAAMFVQVCEAADTPFQWFASRSDLRCGTTVGPIIAAGLGVRTLDVGNPMVSMHSAREMCGTADHPWMIAAMTGFFAVSL